jgi:hypothetical protein
MLKLKVKPRRHRIDRKSLRTMLPGRDLPQPPPTPAAVHVSSVSIFPDDEQIARWTFDRAVQDPTGPLTGLMVFNHRGWAWTRESPSVLRVEHHFDMMSGEPWSNTAGAGGIKSTEGGELEAGSGTVLGR